MDIQQIAALTLFLIVTGISASRLVHRTVAALVGAVVAAAYWGIPGILGTVYPEVLLVTASLMILAGYVKKSGIAAWLALKAAKAGKGRPNRILLLVGALTYLVATFLGPIAAVTLVLPVALLLAVELDVPPLPFVVVLSWSALLGGATVLTAQPGNLWVAAALGLEGPAWVSTLAPYSAATLAVTLVTGYMVFGKRLRVTNERRARVLEFDESRTLGDRPLLLKTLTVLVLVAGGLAAGPWVDLAPSLVTVGGAVLLWLWEAPRSSEKFLSDIDGGLLLFLAAIMAVAGALTVSGLFPATLPAHGSPLLFLWASALFGAFFDQGAVAGALAPLASGSWPALVLGSSLGAGITVLGASSAAALGLSGQGSRKVSWQDFTRFGLLFGVINLAAVSGLMLLLG